MQETINKIIAELIRKSYGELMGKNKTDDKKKKRNKSIRKKNPKTISKILLLFFLVATLSMSGIVCKDGKEKSGHNPLIESKKEQNSIGTNIPRIRILNQ